MYFTILRTPLSPIQRFIKKTKRTRRHVWMGSPQLRVWSQFAAMPLISIMGCTYIQEMYVKSAGKDNFLLLGDTTHIQNCVAHATQSSVDAYSGTVSDFLE